MRVRWFLDESDHSNGYNAVKGASRASFSPDFGREVLHAGRALITSSKRPISGREEMTRVAAGGRLRCLASDLAIVDVEARGGQMVRSSESPDVLARLTGTDQEEGEAASNVTGSDHDRSKSRSSSAWEPIQTPALPAPAASPRRSRPAVRAGRARSAPRALAGIPSSSSSLAPEHRLLRAAFGPAQRRT